MRGASRAGGIAAIVFALAYAGWFVVESLRLSLGFDDGDDPEQSVAFLREHGNIYFFAGVVLVLMAVALIVATLAVAEVLSGQVASLTLRTISAFGFIAAAFFFANGILRLQVRGTLVYMDDLDHDFGLAAYVVVQIAGTQGLASAGIFAASAFAIGICLLRVRYSVLPRSLSLFGILPALPWPLGLLSPLDGIDSSIGWFFYIGGILGGWLWFLALGVVLLRRRAFEARSAAL